MTRLALASALAMLVCGARPATAHPVPFSYIDLRLQPGSMDAVVIVHIFDAAHDLEVTPVERLLDPAVASEYGRALISLLAARLAVTVDGQALAMDWSGPEVLADRQSLRLTAHARLGRTLATVALQAAMFPYDPQHQTFVNIYEGEALTQAILDRGKPRVEYFAGTRQGALAVVGKFVPAGVHHILIGPDHLLFLFGLLLLGGTLGQLALVVSGFTIAHSITLSLAALNLVTPPSRIIEPAIALSVVYVGADNLLVRDGRDMRAWIAFAFGFIHGFGFASVLREMDLPARALGWSLFSFNLGVEIGQLLVVVLVASALGALRAKSETAGRRLAFAGSIVVVAAGVFWFIERTFL